MRLLGLVFSLVIFVSVEALASVAVCRLSFEDEHIYMAAINLGEPIFESNGDVLYPVLDAGVYNENDTEDPATSGLERVKDRVFEETALKLKANADGQGAQVVFNYVKTPGSDDDNALGVPEPYEINFRYENEEVCTKVDFSEWSEKYTELGGQLSKTDEPVNVRPNLVDPVI